MPITAEQRELRRQHIGSSDSAAIAGVSPWATSADVFMSKVYGTDDFSSPAAELGNLLEPVLVKWAAAQLGVEVETDRHVVDPENKILAANLDGKVIGRREAIEAKTTGIIWAGAVSEEWGEEGTAEVPKHVMVQCQHQMRVDNLDVVWVPALIGGRGLVMYQVCRVESLIADIVDIDLAFWRTHVEPKLKPDTQPTLDVAKRVRRVPSKEVPISDDLVVTWQDAREARLLAEKSEAAAQAELLAALGDADAGRCLRGLLTYFEYSRKGYEVKPSKYRQLKLQTK